METFVEIITFFIINMCNNISKVEIRVEIVQIKRFDKVVQGTRKDETIKNY